MDQFDIPSFAEQQAAIRTINAENNAWSAEQAQKQMDFQERMSNTAHQREVDDLIAAGLNPVLSAQRGASSPSGSMGGTDESGASALTSTLGSMLSAFVSLENQRVSAATALAVADKNNAAARLIAELNNAGAFQRQELVGKQQMEHSAAFPSNVWQTVPAILDSLTGQSTSGRGYAAVNPLATALGTAAGKWLSSRFSDYQVKDFFRNGVRSSLYSLLSRSGFSHSMLSALLSGILPGVVPGLLSHNSGKF